MGTKWPIKILSLKFMEGLSRWVDSFRHRSIESIEFRFKSNRDLKCAPNSLFSNIFAFGGVWRNQFYGVFKGKIWRTISINKICLGSHHLIRFICASSCALVTKSQLVTKSHSTILNLGPYK